MTMLDSAFTAIQRMQIWLVPHFEKMLYDQAMLTWRMRRHTWQRKKKNTGRPPVRSCDYVLRDMTDSGGGFYSAEDADSEGVEGKFYVWSYEEIYNILGPSDAGLVIKVFNITKDGNFIDQAINERPGTNILHLDQSLEQTAAVLNMATQNLHDSLKASLQKLFASREKRIHPRKDDKILTDWNGLMIMALAKAAQAFHEPVYADAAERAAAFILKHMRTSEGRLLHRYRDGDASLPAHVDDYAFFISALIELYETVFDTRYLETALELNRDFIRHFWDSGNGGFYFTADDTEEILVRKKEIYDAAIPSGNSVAMLNLLRLGRMTGDPDLEEKAVQTGSAFAKTVSEYPAAYTQLMVAVDFAAGPPCEVVIAGDSQAEDTKTMLQTLRSQFQPNKVVLFRPVEEQSPEIDRISGFTEILWKS